MKIDFPNTITSRISSCLLLTLGISCLTIGQSALAQKCDPNDPLYNEAIGQQGQVITTAVPILTISPDARSAAMGDAGAALSADPNAIYWNPAKLGFLTNSVGGSLSYTPWLKKIIDDMSLSYLSGYMRLGEDRGISASLMYFDLGNINFTDNNNASLGAFNPKEYAFTAAYGQKVSEYLSVGLGLRFIHSNLSGNIPLSSGGTSSRPGNTAAADLGVFYNRPLTLGANQANLAVAAGVSNLGAKISYTAGRSDFIPVNLRLGTAFTYELDPFNKITVAIDANKLLVPTPPRYVCLNDSVLVASGTTPDSIDLFSGVFGSFSDAPGGLEEELKEINYSFGVEYWYNNLFAARAGYFYEHPTKGNRQYLTFGLGLRYQVFGFDVAYLVPSQTNNPLAETLRFTLMFNLDKLENSDQEESVIE
jgi:hypothetical protein